MKRRLPKCWRRPGEEIRDLKAAEGQKVQTGHHCEETIHTGVDKHSKEVTLQMVWSDWTLGKKLPTGR